MACKLAAIDCSVTIQENVLLRVPDNFEYTTITTLQKCPPAFVANHAVSLIREMRKDVDDKAFIDLEVNDFNVGVSICKLGVFSKAGLEQLEWLAGVAKMQENLQEEERWLMQTTNDLDNLTRLKISHLLYKVPLNHLVAKEGKYSLHVRRSANLPWNITLTTLIAAAVSRMQRKCHLNESLLCLLVHTIT